ncbi:MAG: hypothetical protein KGV56_01325 [Gammaproteobacteria bacterium]|nr:hypothetical protein [Gammaproteobacteria bacterium]
MFNIDKIQDTYSWKIEVEIPNNGQYDKFSLKVKYNRLPHSERVELLERTPSTEEDVMSFEREMIKKIFAGWEKGQIKDANGVLEDTPENRAKLLEITEFRVAVINGYTESTGGNAVKLGNSLG